MSTDDRAREDQIAAEQEEAGDAFLRVWNLQHLDAAGAAAILDAALLAILDPQTRAILDEWKQGGTGLPWVDAAGPGDTGETSTEEEGPHQPGESAPTAA